MGMRRLRVIVLAMVVSLPIGGLGVAYFATHGQAAAPGGAACDVTYAVTAQWTGRFTANLTVRNTGAAEIDGWTLRWSFPDGQTVAQGWNGRFDQNGRTVAVTDAGWNSRIAAGAGTGIGFNASSAAANTAPGAFSLNGVACTVDGASSPAPTGTPTPTPTTTPTDTASSTATPSTPPTTGPTATATTVPTATDPALGTALGDGRIQYGPTYTGEGTFYGATGEGNCSYGATDDRMIAAMNHADYENSQACGAYAEVTGPTGTTVTVMIVDQCPECKPGDIDLSAEAFALLAEPSAGRIPISWTLLSPALDGPVAYQYKEGSSQWWCGIQVRDHRNPVRALEVLVDGSWQSLPRQPYNYFVSADGSGCGSTIRVTDIYGNQVTDSGITLSPGTVQPGTAQFGPPW